MNNKNKHRVVKILFSSFLFLGGAVAAWSQAKAEENKDPSSLVIETDPYCAFLNSEASADYNDLFDAQITGLAPSAFLQRSGVPGSYHYEVIPGQEKVALPYLSKAEVVQYSAWREQLGEQGMLNNILTSSSADALDPALKSNGLFFALTTQQASGPSASSDANFWENLTWQEKVGVGMAGVLFVAGGTTAVNEFRNERALDRQREVHNEALFQQETRLTERIDRLKQEHRNALAHKQQEHQFALQRQVAEFQVALARQRVDYENQMSGFLKRQEVPNQAYYSVERRSIYDDMAEEMKELPVIGHFQAGTRLLGELSEEIMDAMYSSTIGKGDGVFDQLRKDLPRSTSVTLKGGGNLIRLGGSSLTGNEEKIDEEINRLNSFLEGTHLLDALGSMLNQTLASACAKIYSRVPRASLSEPNNMVNFFTEGALGFPSPSATKADKSPGKIIYELERIAGEGDHTFLLTLMNITEFQGFHFHQGEEYSPQTTIPFTPELSQPCRSTLKLKITSNPDFNPEEPISKDNFPCRLVECVEFRNEYEIYQKPPIQVSIMVPNATRI